MGVRASQNPKTPKRLARSGGTKGPAGGERQVYVKKWLKTPHAIIFRLSNKTIQVLLRALSLGEDEEPISSRSLTAHYGAGPPSSPSPHCKGRGSLQRVGDGSGTRDPAKGRVPLNIVPCK